ncbi:hypothetical protein ACQP2Y_21175 [Actinoplanes sp. CA-051413]|uniref:hypothetical protein n=1 Tax=Actinoplanes sp. CA-051413 TaxID=3239899 RepID=UPI003D95B0FE
MAPEQPGVTGSFPGGTVGGFRVTAALPFRAVSYTALSDDGRYRLGDLAAHGLILTDGDQLRKLVCRQRSPR